jgi:MFS family permease
MADPIVLSNSSEALSREYYQTPDFRAMIKILFWNSQGFFFFSFITPIVAAFFLDATGTDIGIILSVRVFGGLISLPIAGYLTDKFHTWKKPMVLIGAIGRGTAYFLFYAAIQLRSLAGLEIAMFVQGFGVGIYWPPYDALISEKTSKYHRSFAFGQRGSMIGWGNLVGTLISFAIYSLTSTYTPTNTWLLFCPLLLFGLTNYYGGWIFYKQVDINLSFDRYLRECQPELESSLIPIELLSNQPESKEMNGQKHMFGNVSPLFFFGLVMLFAGLIVQSLNEIITKPVILLYMYANITENAAMIMLLFFPSEILAQLLGAKLGYWADRINNYFGIALCASLGAIVTYGLISVKIGWLFSILLIIDATLARITGLIIQNILSRMNPGHRGLLFSMKTWTGHLGEAVGPILGGWLWDTSGQRAPFLASIGIELSLIPIFFMAFACIHSFIQEKIIKKSKT